MAMLDRVPAIVQAPGALAELGSRAAAICGKGSAVLLVADGGLAGHIDRAKESLRDAGLVPQLFTEFASDPGVAAVDRAADLARRERADLVVALGGGSAMDVGKAVAGVARGTLPAAAYGLCAAPLPAAPLAKICVPTTSGTGSETTRTAVLANADGAKIWLWGDTLKADLVLLDPALTVGLPAHLTAATGIDALVHAIEAVTNANAFPANDVYGHGAIRLVAENLERAVAAPDDLEARGAMQLAAALAGIAIDNCGTAIAHNIGHALASLRPIHHGRAVGLAMLATIDWNAEAGDARFAAVAAAMGEREDARAVPIAFERLLRAVGVPVSLGEAFVGVTSEALAAQMQRPENEPMRRSNRRPVGDDDLRRFAAAVLAQS
ncbi:MAG: iron-containing alcohol dehydrogenase [Alphaproteobacteria bacterium]